MSIKRQQIPLLHYEYFEEMIWSKQYIDKLIEEPSGPDDYPNVLADIKNCVDKISLKDMRILVIGSITPWVEGYLIHLGATKVYITDANKMDIRDDRIEFIEISAIKNNKFDLVISFSSVEHFGLGRYNDELDENGDIKFMTEISEILNNAGFFILGVPVAEEYKLCMPWHRIYDKNRLSDLTNDYTIVMSSKNGKTSDSVDFSLDTAYEFDWQNQPCILLIKKYVS